MIQLKIFKENHGVGIVSALIALGIAGMVAVFLSKVLKNSLSGQKRVQQDSELTAIGHSLLNRVDCNVSLGPPPTTCSGPVTLLDQLGNVIVDSAGSVFGRWTVKATCNAGINEVVIRASRPLPGPPGTYAKDPLTGALLDGTTRANDRLFPAGAGLCGASFATSAFARFGTVIGAVNYSTTSDSWSELGDTQLTISVTGGPAYFDGRIQTFNHYPCRGAQISVGYALLPGTPTPMFPGSVGGECGSWGAKEYLTVNGITPALAPGTYKFQLFWRAATWPTDSPPGPCGPVNC